MYKVFGLKVYALRMYTVLEKTSIRLEAKDRKVYVKGYIISGQDRVHYHLFIYTQIRTGNESQPVEVVDIP